MKKSIERTLIGVGIGALLWAGTGLFSYQMSNYCTGKAQDYEESRIHHQDLVNRMEDNLKQYDELLERWKTNEVRAEKIGQKELAELCKREYGTTLAKRDDSKKLYDTFITDAKEDAENHDVYMQKSKKWKDFAKKIDPFH